MDTISVIIFYLNYEVFGPQFKKIKEDTGLVVLDKKLPRKMYELRRNSETQIYEIRPNKEVQKIIGEFDLVTIIFTRDIMSLTRLCYKVHIKKCLELLRKIPVECRDRNSVG